MGDLTIAGRLIVDRQSGRLALHRYHVIRIDSVLQADGVLRIDSVLRIDGDRDIIAFTAVGYIVALIAMCGQCASQQ
ncbi:MAG: hypothetical protein LBL55_11015 [Propionibacteriaceae bacterium]|nr:hypothetical protein [Propionibacteriaceae bacterium]